MKNMWRNEQKFWYCLYVNDRKPDKPDEVNYIVDERGHETGERILQYSTEVQMRANISPATGNSNTEQFGGLEDYDKVIVTHDMSCPIDENTVLFLDKLPEWSEVKTYEVEEPASGALYSDDVLAEKTYLVPNYDYIVKRVARSLNVISIAVRKVKVG